VRARWVTAILISVSATLTFAGMYGFVREFMLKKAELGIMGLAECRISDASYYHNSSIAINYSLKLARHIRGHSNGISLSVSLAEGRERYHTVVFNADSYASVYVGPSNEIDTTFTREIVKIHDGLFDKIDINGRLLANISIFKVYDNIWRNKCHTFGINSQPCAVCSNQRPSCGFICIASNEGDSKSGERQYQSAVSGNTVMISSLEPSYKSAQNQNTSFWLAGFLSIGAIVVLLVSAAIGIGGHSELVRLPIGIALLVLAGWILYHSMNEYRFGTWDDPLRFYLTRHLQD
jgi:hypothetical protein